MASARAGGGAAVSGLCSAVYLTDASATNMGQCDVNGAPATHGAAGLAALLDRKLRTVGQLGLEAAVMCPRVDVYRSVTPVTCRLEVSMGSLLGRGV